MGLGEFTKEQEDQGHQLSLRRLKAQFEGKIGSPTIERVYQEERHRLDEQPLRQLVPTVAEGGACRRLRVLLKQQQRQQQI